MRTTKKGCFNSRHILIVVVVVINKLMCCCVLQHWSSFKPYWCTWMWWQPVFFHRHTRTHLNNNKKSSSSIACTLCTLTHRQLTHFSWFLSLKHNCLMFISRNRIEWNLFVLSLLFEFLLKICGFHTFQTVHPSHVFFSITSSFLCYGCYHSGNKPHNQFIIALHIEWMCTFG